MTTKKFPTPTLDALLWNEDKDVINAVQADIALAVEAARVTVPDDVRHSLTFLLNVISMETTDLEDHLHVARKWLESLAVAPKDAPVEKRCGTCANLDSDPAFCREYRAKMSDRMNLEWEEFVPTVAYEHMRKDFPVDRCWKAKP